MDKIRRNLFSGLRKAVSGVSFRQVIHVGLIAATFILAGCSSSSIPSATATATPEVTATSTATFEPTPTIAPKPDYVTDDNSVQTDSGTVFIKDGKIMLYDLKTGEIKEVEDLSSDVTFNTTEDASKIMLALHTKEFADQEQMYKDLTPGVTGSEFEHGMELNHAPGAGTMTNGVVSPFPGLPAEFVKVKSPIKTIAFPEMGVVMLKQYANPRPVPLILGVFERSGNFHPFFNTLVTTPAANFPRKYVESAVDNNQTWEATVAILKDRVIKTWPLFSRDPTNTTPYVPVEWSFDPGNITSSVVGERERLIQFELKQAGLADSILRQAPLPKKQGEYYAKLEQLMLATGNSNYYFIDDMSLLHTIVQ